MVSVLQLAAIVSFRHRCFLLFLFEPERAITYGTIPLSITLCVGLFVKIQTRIGRLS